LVDPKGTDYASYRRATLITPNRAELQQVVGAWKDETELRAKAQALREQLQLDAILLTRSEEGMTLYDAAGELSIGAQAREELLALRGDGGAAHVVAAWKQRGGLGVLELDDVGCITDVDTPEALRAAKALALHMQARQSVGE
jgi:bifunctional ADP-heptose synthase (sugar kinase/adenylyltransferase)